MFEDHRGERRAFAGADGGHEVAVTGRQQSAPHGREVVHERVRAEQVPSGRQVVQQHAVHREAEQQAQPLPGHDVHVVRQDQAQIVQLEPGAKHRLPDDRGQDRPVFALALKPVMLFQPCQYGRP